MPAPLRLSHRRGRAVGERVHPGRRVQPQVDGGEHATTMTAVNRLCRPRRSRMPHQPYAAARWSIRSFESLRTPMPVPSTMSDQDNHRRCAHPGVANRSARPKDTTQCTATRAQSPDRRYLIDAAGNGNQQASAAADDQERCWRRSR